ncbi:MAG: Asp-tRNA(Asn)/Glu-tRNA(Gln) amidotransferase subunit GatB [Deltaproteobacteria bacterium]|nr:Asp-tRNA(Asn)/Glu-tRNA(Gln) amidotransferase subunit GatB [Deltaproteobacteria bacterium]
MEFEPTIGLEVHAQLKTNTKIFCGCATAFGNPPNTHTCPICLGMPGVLPSLNKKVVDFALRMPLATNCKIAPNSRFARKNYFYPDLPKGYQISQYESPLAQHGRIEISIDGVQKKIGINRIHMEEDAGKLNHDPDQTSSRVDFNRTGVPLIEIVSEPDLQSPQEAVAYLKQLRTIVRYLDICDGNMEEGSFRCDANISIRPKGNADLGTRTEIKNLNSFKHVEKALLFEIRRQREAILDGGRVHQETRLYDPDKNRTTSMRDKEEAHDYRYFPDPDLLPLVIDEGWINRIKASLPELPDAKRVRFIKQYNLPEYDADVLTTSRELSDYYETCVALMPDPKLVSNWIMGPLMGQLNMSGLSIRQPPIDPEKLTQLLKLVDEGAISNNAAKTVFEEMAASGQGPGQIVTEKGLIQLSDAEALEVIVKQILQKHAQEVKAYQAGKTKLLGFFMGRVMKETRGRANPQMVRNLLKKTLGG